MSSIILPHSHGNVTQKVIEHMPGDEAFFKVSECFSLLGDSSRLKILWLLCHSEECVSNISAAVQMSPPLVSHHLKLLKTNGLITSRREGKEVYYALASTDITEVLHHALDEMMGIHCPREAE